MKKSTLPVIAIVTLSLLVACSNKEEEHSHSEATQGSTKETFSIENLVQEVKTVPDSIIEYLHAQHHSHKVLERRVVPPGYETPEMKYWIDHAKAVEDLPVINPGPGEYVHVMEGQKNGYKTLVIGITETFPGGAPPMHTHEGEESHVLLEGEILYALGDTLFTIKAPYIINIP